MEPRPGKSHRVVQVAIAFFALAFVIGAAWTVGHFFGEKRNDPDDPEMYHFAGLRGPAEPSVVAAPVTASWKSYDEGAVSRLAILLTDEQSDWLGLAHGLKSIGIPFRITRDASEAVKHKVVLVYPTISGKVLAADELRALARVPADGGTLVGFGIEGGGLDEVFGFSGTEPSRTALALKLDPSADVMAGFTDARESTLPLNSGKGGGLGVLKYAPTKATVLATYDEGGAGIIRRAVGHGFAYAFGVDLGYLLLRGYNYRQEGVARSYVNEYEPNLDVFLQLLRNIYARGEPGAVTLSTVPGGCPMSVLLTHDIDFTRSIKNVVEYAEMERGLGVGATYFIQTKYVRDWNDDVFFDDTVKAPLARLKVLGMEIASHSVSHSRVFAGFPMGTGREAYPEYRPFVVKQTQAVHASILGELRVSRYLLEQMTPGLRVRSFRPGHLSNPFNLPQALAAAGFDFSSSITANSSLTHLPFRLTYARGKEAQTPTYEFPVTIEDELPPRLDTRLPEAIAVADHLAKYGGVMNVLIHTDITAHKLEFERGLIEALKKRHAWFGTVETFGDWWRQRDRVDVATSVAGASLVVRLQSDGPIEGLCLEIPDGWKLHAVPATAGAVHQDGNLVVIARFEGKVALTFDR